LARGGEQSLMDVAGRFGESREDTDVLTGVVGCLGTSADAVLDPVGGRGIDEIVDAVSGLLA